MAQRKFAEIDVQLLTLLKNHNFNFKTVYDVGASNGTWSLRAGSVFPDAVFHLFDPLLGVQESYAARLKRVLEARPEFSLHRVALGDLYCPNGNFFVTEDGFGSTILNVDSTPGFMRCSVAIHPLDNYVADHRLPPPDLIKMDVQAGEIRILRGATQCLQQASALLLETWLYREYGPETPLLGDVIAYVSKFGFDLVEIGDRYYDETHKLTSIDALFLKRDALSERKGTLPLGDWVQRA